jgi:DNA polymerase-3 subunit alpha
MLTKIKKHIDKNGNNMAFISMEDIAGQIEGVVFASNYEQVSDNLQEEIPLIIWAKIDQKDDKIQLIINNIEAVAKVAIVLIEMTIQEASDSEFQNKLKSILQEQSGDKNKAKIPVIGIINSYTERIFVRFHHKFWVQNDVNTIESLKNAGFQAYSQFLKQ